MTNQRQPRDPADIVSRLGAPRPGPRPPRRRYELYVLALLIGAYLVTYTVASLQLRSETAHLRAERVPLTYADALPPIPDSDNAAVLYLRAFDGLRRHGGRRELISIVYPRTGGETWAMPEWPKLEALLARHAQELRLLEAASIRPRCRFWTGRGNPVEYDYAQGLAGVRTATDFLVAKALMDARQGRQKQVVGDFATAIRMSNHLGGEPSLFAQRVRFACLARVSASVPRIIEQARPNASELRGLYDLLARVDVQGPFLNALPLEQSRGLRMFDQPARRQLAQWFVPPPTAPGYPTLGTGERLRMWLASRAVGKWWPVTRVVWGPFIKLEQVHRLREARDAAILASKPYRQTRDRWQRLADEAERGPTWYAIVPYSQFPIYDRDARLRDTTIARLGLAQAALALKAYQVEHGRYPASLAELRAAGGWAIPNDPFSGKPLGYRQDGHGCLVYSIGDDLADDGGIDQNQAAMRRAESGPIGPPGGPLTYDRVLRMKQ